MKDSEQEYARAKEEFEPTGGVIYDEEERNALLDNDEVAPWEEGFMEGYEGA